MKNPQRETIAMKYSSAFYVQKLAGVLTKASGKTIPESMLESERIIKWCMQRRQALNIQLYNTLRSIHNLADYHLTSALHDEHDNMSINLCGPSKHSISTESYFYETTYLFHDLRNTTVVIDKRGLAMNILPLTRKKADSKTWICDVYCRVNHDSQILIKYQDFLQLLATMKLKNFSNFLQQCFRKHCQAKLGHLSHCYIDQNPCQSEYFVLELLSPHFPKVRTLKRNLYRMREGFRELEELDTALETSDLIVLQKVADAVKLKGKSFYNTSDIICLDEDGIQTQHEDAFVALTRKSLDQAKYRCTSCQSLEFKRNSMEISRLRIPINNDHWKDLQNYLLHNPEFKSIFICDYCLKKFRQGRLPPTCIVNNLDVGSIPEHMKNLNSYEKILIQRAKVYQVVQRTGTVRKKNIPHTMRNQKLLGQTFYLPLPLEHSLDKICSTTEPINKNHELYILVRGIPTKSKTIWQELVDMDKIFKVLQWLQSNNPLYSEIQLPKSARELLRHLNSTDVQYQLNCEDDAHSSSSTLTAESDSALVSEPENENSSMTNHVTINKEVIVDKTLRQVGKEVNIPHQNDDSVDLCEEMQLLKMNERDNDNSKVSATNKQVNVPRVGENDKTQRAMLTLVKNSDLQYEHYTLYPINDKRMNDTASNIYQMLKVRDLPLDNKLKTLDLMCFPDLYPHGKGGQHENRKELLTEFEYSKLRLKSADPRFRLNLQYLFYLLNQTNIRQLSAGIYHMLHMTNPREKMTAESYLSKLTMGALEANLNTLFERLRNSEQYWRKPRNDLICMTRHYGPATWFLTISPAEWLWKDLCNYIREVNASYLDALSDGELIAADPVSTSRFINNKFEAMLDFILSESQPIGKVTHYFWRREYQSRGIQHFHILLWVEDAPILGKNSNEEVVQFISKYVTCRIPDRKISPMLHRRVTTHQQHVHNSYCLRNKKEKSGKISSRCRFGFSRPVTDHFELRDPAISIAGRKNLSAKSRLYDLPRTEKEKNINDYNPVILTAWEGNMDIQFIGESSSLLTSYCTKYATKHETSKTSKVFDEINSTKTLHQRLWNVAFRSLQNREIGALEAADTLLGISLYGSDRQTTIRWLNVNMIRGRKVKSHEEILKLEKNSTSIFCPSWIDDTYVNRPAELENECLYDFSKWYDKVNYIPKNESVEYYTLRPGVYLKRRKSPYLINHYRFNVNVQPEKYFHSLLLLFKPWRDVSDLKGDFETYADAFEAQKEKFTEATKYHECAENFQRGIDYINELINKNMEDSANKNDDKSYTSNKESLGCIPKEGLMAMQELKDIDDNAAKRVDLSQMMAQMNADQARIFATVTSTLSSKDKILRLYVSGEGGTGKSFLIDAIRTWTREKLNAKTIVTAPTGIAAFNVNGLTVYRGFQLPVEHDNTPAYTQLSDPLLKLMREEFRNVELIIIDEISMLSNVTFMYINQRLVEIFDTSAQCDGWFGRKHILLFGDLLQLPPVHAEFSFVELSSSEVEKRLGALSTINLWTNLFTYDQLTINMRQKTDPIYGTLLSRLRTGSMTTEDIAELEKRRINLHEIPHADRIKKLCDYIGTLPADTICLFSTRQQCDAINEAMLTTIPSDEIILIAEDSVDSRDRSLKARAMKLLDKIEKDDRSSAGLSKYITVKIGAKIMLRRNIDVSLGLVNGTIATILSISKIIDKGTEKINSIVVSLQGGQTYSLERMDVKFQIIDGVFITRRQFPICLSYGVTIHKSQGLSLKNAVIDVGNKVFATGQTYVALSRVTTLDGLHLINIDPSGIKANEAAIEEYNRLRKKYRNDLPQIYSSNSRHFPKIRDVQWAFKEFPVEIDEPNINVHCESSVHGLPNLDGSSSYVNAVLQCVFHCSYLRQLLLKQVSTDHEILSKFLKEYSNTTSTTSLNPRVLKVYLDENYCQDEEQDPSEFLEAVCEKTQILKNGVTHTFKHIDKCTECKYTTERKVVKSVFHLLIKNVEKTPIELDKLFGKFFNNWIYITEVCHNCQQNVKILRKISVDTTSNILVVKLHLDYNDTRHERKNNTISIKAVPTCRLVIGGIIYKTLGAIFCDNDGKQQNHYRALLRHGKNEWIEADDAAVQLTRWPRNAKNIDMIFLEKIK